MLRAGRIVLMVALASFCCLTSSFLPSQQARAATLSCVPPATDPELAGLARALNYNLEQIYEYVYYNIDLTPTFGSKKGALATYLDRNGNNADQNVLFVNLLRQSCITANFRYGTVSIPGDAAASLYGVQNDTRILNNVIGNGGIPGCIQTTTGGSCVSSSVSGRATAVTIQMVWTEASIGNNVYRLDPSFKSHTVHKPINFARIGYNRNNFMGAASIGRGAINIRGLPAGIVSRRGVNKDNIDAGLNNIAHGLATYIKQNHPTSSNTELFGGRTITKTNYGSVLPASGALYASLPAALETSVTITVSNNTDGSSPTISTTVYGTQVASRNLMLTYNASNQPVLSLDGTVLATGTAALAGATQTVSMTATQPYTAPFNTYTTRQSAVVGGSYAVMIAPGEVGRDTLTRYQTKQFQQLKASGGASNQNVTNASLAAIGYAYLSQSSMASQLYGGFSTLVPVRHIAMGLAGVSPGKGAYVDFPAQLSGASQGATSVNEVDLNAYAIAAGIFNSTLESTTVAQFQEAEAVSTVRMFDYAVRDNTGFIQATAANWRDVVPRLTGWSAADLSAMGNFLTTTPNSQIMLPQNGSRTVGAWTGSGWYEIDQSSGLHNIAYRISGGYKGGFSVAAYDVNAATSLAPTTQTQSLAPRSWDPIDMLTGNYLYDHKDLELGSANTPFGLTLVRSYNSGNASNKSPLGYGWQHNFMLTAKVDSDSYLGFGQHNPIAAVPTITAFYVMLDLNRQATPALPNVVVSSLVGSWLMDGLVKNTITTSTPLGTKKFTKIPAGNGKTVYVPPPGDGSNVVLNSDGTIVLTEKSGQTAKFDVAGDITSWADTNGNTLSFAYTGTGASKLLGSVSNGIGRTLTFSYAGDNLTSVSDGTRSISYTYDASGNLSTFKDAKAAITTFLYAPSSSLVTQIRYPAFPDTAAVTNTYDVFGRILTQADALGNLWTYQFANGARSNEINPLGGQRTFYFDANGNPTLETDQNGDTTTKTYDGIGRLLTTKHPFGNAVTLAYDAKSNVLSSTKTPVPGAIDPLNGALAAPIVERWTYTNLSKPATYINPNGYVTRYTYDAKGNLLATIQPAVVKPGANGVKNPVTTTAYNSRGLPVTMTDPEGRVTTYRYSETTFDLLSTVVDSGAGRLNLTTSATYDAVGNAITKTDANGNTTAYSYDANRQLVQITPAAPFAANVTQYAYDANGNRTAIAQATGSAATPWRTTVTSYNAADKPVTVTAPDGTTSTTAYDVLLRVATMTYSSGRQAIYTYDSASHVLSVTDGVAGTLDPSIVRNMGSVTRERRTYFARSGGLLASLADGNGNALTYSYDGFGRLKQISYPDIATAPNNYDLHVYDPAGNEVAFQRRDQSLIRYTYDGLNRLTSKAPSGAAAISYGYDYSGRMLTAQASNDSSPLRIGYDGAGRKISETSPLFGTTTAMLDANGNQTRLAYPPSVGYSVGYSYDTLNRMTGIYNATTATGFRLVGFGYDALSQRINASYGSAGTPVASSTVGYTSVGQIAALNHTWNGSSLKLGYTYNKDHQRTSLTASDSTFLPSGLTAGSTAYTANNLNQYTALAGQGAATYRYDGRGNLTNDGVWTYGYDTENRLVSASKPGTSITYGYDPLGRRLSKNVNGVTTVWSSYDDRELAEYSGRGTVFFSRMFAYGPGLDEPVASVAPGGAMTYHYQDALGSVIAHSNAAGLVTEKYAYTAYGLNTVAGPGTAAFRYAGRRYEPETGLYYNRARAYSPTLGRFLQTDPIGTAGGINLYAYTGNNPVNLTDPTGQYWWVGAAYGALAGAISGAIAGYEQTESGWGVVTGALAGAVVGAVVGHYAPGSASAVGGSAGRALAFTAANALGSGAESLAVDAAVNLVGGGNKSTSDILRDARIATLTGGLGGTLSGEVFFAGGVGGARLVADTLEERIVTGHTGLWNAALGATSAGATRSQSNFADGGSPINPHGGWNIAAGPLAQPPRK